jgi:hypothetical protein
MYIFIPILFGCNEFDTSAKTTNWKINEIYAQFTTPLALQIRIIPMHYATIYWSTDKLAKKEKIQ